jgi:hypothetical protein
VPMRLLAVLITSRPKAHHPPQNEQKARPFLQILRKFAPVFAHCEHKSVGLSL